MINIYKEFGFYKEGIHTLTMKGIEGAQEIQNIMDRLRKDPPKQFADLKVKEFRDYKKNEVIDMATGAKSETGLPESNVLYFELENDSWCCARPSGTEPKIKFYMGIKGENLEDADARLSELKEAVLDKIR